MTYPLRLGGGAPRAVCDRLSSIIKRVRRMKFFNAAAPLESRRLASLTRSGVLACCCLFGLTPVGITPGAIAASHLQSKPLAPIDLPDSTSLLGSYLAGRLARQTRDNESAAFYYARTLAKDPGNEDILDDAFQLELAAGNFDTARVLAQRLIKRQKENAIAHIFLGLEAFKKKDFARADENFKIAERSTAGEPTVKLSRAWVAVAQGRPEKAISLLEAPSKAGWATHFETVQRGFIADVGKRKDAATGAFKAAFDKKPPNSRVSEAYARHLAYWGDKERAKAVLAEGSADATPMGKAMLAEMAAGKTPKLMVSNVEEGLGEVFLGIGQVLATNNGVDAAQIYLRLALFLNPNSDITELELAEIYGGLEQYQKAIDVLDKVPEGSSFWLNVQLRKALNLNAFQKTDDAVALLKRLLEKRPDDGQIAQTIASIESARKSYEASIPYYDRAIASVKDPEKKNWGLFYARGISFERTKQWDKAEADFKKALELNPEEASVLNYLGYSWLDQNINVPQAFEYIKKAVNLRPNDGYIIDSLGWGYYVQKDYEQAVKNLDRAVELRPEDPTLNDHLGDVYWRLGRKLEAQFQWSQALTLSPEPADAAKIRKKLETGLPDDSGPRAELESRPVENAPSPASNPADAGTTSR